MLLGCCLLLWEELDACCFQKWTISSWCFKGSFKFRQMWRWLFLASGHFGRDAGFPAGSQKERVGGNRLHGGL